MNIVNVVGLIISGKWLIIYCLPAIVLIGLCLRKVSFKVQKKRQTWLYFCEIYYTSLFLTMIFTKLQTNTFWLWESSENLDTILSRFFLCYAIYQIFVLVKRKLDSSANADSFQSLKTLLNRLIIYRESNMKKKYEDLIQSYEDKAIKEKTTMLNSECLELFNQTKLYDFNNPELLVFLKFTSEYLDHKIQLESFSWAESFLLNILK